MGVILPLGDGFDFFADVLGPHPAVRRVLMRLMYNAKAALDFLHDAWPELDLFSRAAFWLAHTDPMSALLTTHGMVVEYDKEGKVLQSWHSTGGKTTRLERILFSCQFCL